MNYRVAVTATAKAEAEEAYLWIRQHSPNRAAKWYIGLIKTIQSLEFQPHRCPLAPEAPVFRQEIRQLLYGKRKGIYRILFEIRDDVVYVLHIRHAARRFLEP
jgi:plasmid stabilization system protein ParE